MPLTSGDRIGAYEIITLLGAGGMGEVYRARDAKLKRDVALKVLPPSFAQDADRLARFQREAELLASVNHPNIAAVYGLEGEHGSTAIVLELVEGMTLADRLAHGALPIDEALPIARQIAEALECAHDRGVIHRDLKPANIKVLPDGTVKVLDFGLAKMVDPTGPRSSGAGAGEPAPYTHSPTLSVHATMAGVILGTAAYMSPEQARGKPVDRRADIWAFGCVLFEMLTGRQTFEGGETVTDTVAAIIKNEPDWTALPGETPAHIRALLKRCLRKDPKRRLRDIGDARLELEEGPLGPSDVVATVGAGLQAAPTRASVLAWALAAAAIIVALALATVILRHREPADFGTVRLSIAPPEGETFGHSSAPRGAGPPAPHFAPSPDGKRLAYIMYAAEKPPQLWVQRLDALSGQPLPGTDDASFPFWSPDSRFVGFFAQGKLKKIEASGGPPQTICDAPNGEGGTWNRDGDIVFARDEASGLSRVSAAGGVPAALTALDVTSHETSHRWPQFLPDGRHFLYLAMTGAVRGAPRPTASVGEDRSLYVGSLDAVVPIPILKDVLRGQYASGRLLFLKDTTLMAQPFDTKQWRLTGDPVSLAEQVARNADNGRTALGASDGVLMYRIDARAGGTSRLAWFDRGGKRLGSVGAPADYAAIQLAPDGKAVATYIQDAATTNGDLWTVDLARGGIPSRLTLTSDQAEVGAAWSPDGTRVAYATGPGVGNMSDLYAKPTNGVRDAELLLKSGRGMHATSWSPDGRYIAFQQTDLKTGLDIWLLPLAGDRKPVPFLQSSFAESSAAFSPDGRWIAYTSDKGGSVSTDVYVRPFPSGDREWRVSQAGGSYPQWRGDGQELYYLDLSSSAVMAVAITGGATLEPAPPVKLFTSPLIRVFGRGRHYTVTADGQRFLMIEPGASAQSTGQAPILVVVNWAAALRK